MARVRSIQPMSLNARRHPTEVDCGYQVFESEGGRMLQLSTFGSDQRKSDPKVSQTLQLDRQGAAALVKLLNDTFPGISDEYA